MRDMTLGIDDPGGRRVLCCLLVALILAVTTAADAQVFGIDAEFAGAGARALAMGSAFIALGDDATASEFNPAGLCNLRRPEIALQGSYTHDRHKEFLPVSSLKEIAEGDGRPRSKWFTDDYASFSFAAFTYPTQNFTLSLSQLTPVYFERSFDDSAEIFGQETLFFRDQETSLTNWGLSLAFPITPDFYVGITGKYGRFTYDERSTLIDDTLEDDTLGANLGLLWQFHPWFSVGTVYKTEQEIDVTFGGQPVHLQIPRTAGVGLAFHPDDRLRLLGDIDYVEWSDFDSSLAANRESGRLLWKRQDVTRYHLGLEYLLGMVSNTNVFARGGWMLEESNASFYDGEDPYFRQAAPRPHDIDHLTLGLGLGGSRAQLDFAMDYSDESIQYILSTVIYF